MSFMADKQQDSVCNYAYAAIPFLKHLSIVVKNTKQEETFITKATQNSGQVY